MENIGLFFSILKKDMFLPLYPKGPTSKTKATSYKKVREGINSVGMLLG